MPSVAFWPGQAGGTAQYRCHTPGEALRRLGWDVTYIDALDVTPKGRVRDDPDVLVISRIMGADLPDALRRITRYGATFVVYDTDDWFGGIPDYNPAARLRDDPVDNIDVMHRAMGEANLITCSTPELAEAYSHLGRTVILPNYLDPDIWSDNDRYRTPHLGIHVGWLGAFHWRSGDLEQLRPWLPHFLEQHPEVRFVAAGCRELLEWLGIDGLTTPAMPGNTGMAQDLRPYEHLPAMLGAIDIGLIPLAQNRFNQAKSWCKGLEYNAMGIPAVASPSREYRSYIRPGVNGLFARRGHWSRQIETIMDDLDAYRDGARKIAAEYMIDDHAHNWVVAYLS